MNDPNEDLLFRKDLEIIGFEILTLEDFYKTHDSGYLASTKTLKFFEILLIVDGEGHHIIDFESYPLREQNIVFIGKNRTHSWQRHLSCTGYVILFTENFLYKNQIQFNELSYDYPYNSVLYGPVVDIPNVRQFETYLSLIRVIHQEYAFVTYEAQQEVLQGLFRTLIVKIQSQLSIKEPPAQKKSKEIFLKFQKALDAYYSSTKNATDYVNILGISYHQLNAAVKEYTGKSVKAFIDHTVVFNAKRSLTDADTNVSEIAYSLGFDEPTNFTKFFKKHTQQTPKLFRDRLLKQ